VIWTIEYDILVQKQIKKLDPQTRNRIRWFLHERLTQLDNPRTLGNALKGSELGNYRRYRIL
jgi:mRNA interferase RelE/StbE